MQLTILLILNLKMRVICRECNIEINTNSGYPEHELMDHYNISHKNLIGRCMKFMYKTYSGYHFFDKCKVKRTGLISSVHSCNDYTDFNDNIDNNKDKDDLDKVLNEIKDNIIEDLRNYIKNELKTEIVNELKTEILNNFKIESNIKNKSNKTNNKTTKVCCLCKIE